MNISLFKKFVSFLFITKLVDKLKYICIQLNSPNEWWVSSSSVVSWSLYIATHASFLTAHLHVQCLVECWDYYTYCRKTMFTNVRCSEQNQSMQCFLADNWIFIFNTTLQLYQLMRMKSCFNAVSVEMSVNCSAISLFKTGASST